MGTYPISPIMPTPGNIGTGRALQEHSPASINATQPALHRETCRSTEREIILDGFDARRRPRGPLSVWRPVSRSEAFRGRWRIDLIEVKPEVAPRDVKQKILDALKRTAELEADAIRVIDRIHVAKRAVADLRSYFRHASRSRRRARRRAPVQPKALLQKY